MGVHFLGFEPKIILNIDGETTSQNQRGIFKP